MTVDIYDIAIYCRDLFKEQHNSEKCHYSNTLFAAITEDGKIQTSYTPHILKGCHQAILMHKYVSLAYQNWYEWYKIEFIDFEGSVRPKAFDEDFTLEVGANGSYRNQIMVLSYRNFIIYRCNKDWEKNLKYIWNLYLQCKNCNSKEEILLLARLADKDKTILAQKEEITDLNFTTTLLKKERDQYKELLEEIKKLVELRN